MRMPSNRWLLLSWLSFGPMLGLSAQVKQENTSKAIAASQEPPYCLEKFVPTTPNRIDEPLAKKFSLDKAARFLDSVNLDWQEKTVLYVPYQLPLSLGPADDLKR